ncbi:MAG: septum formation initiator family protein [Bacteroidetes Order II. Incertae sedis bacterium]|nr:septum formation initiator family protein [Bacteroidetes Order II. bacterium]
MILLFGLIWVVFFDSYSFTNRMNWEAEKETLLLENKALKQELQALESQILHVDSSEVIEQSARKRFGMRRPGEIVYQIRRDTTHKP